MSLPHNKENSGEPGRAWGVVWKGMKKQGCNIGHEDVREFLKERAISRNLRIVSNKIINTLEVHFFPWWSIIH